MKRKFICIALCGVIMLTASCAMILTGTRQKVTFKSNVDGKVFQNLTEIGKTNEAILIRRKDIPKLYTIKSEGCPEKSVELPVNSNPVFFVNILFGLFIPAYFDLASGSNMKTDKVIAVDLDCKGKK